MIVCCRGALFFGPAWRVTRNKLTFRDPLPELLATATPSDRGIDKRLREWLRDCHTRLDRILHFAGPADVELKVRDSSWCNGAGSMRRLLLSLSGTGLFLGMAIRYTLEDGALPETAPS